MIAKTVLPTGASGLVGCQAIAPLHRLGDKVHAVGNAATARSIARAHGGDIVLERREERGLRAKVVLPRETGA